MIAIPKSNAGDFGESDFVSEGTYEAKLVEVEDLPDYEQRKYRSNDTETIHAIRLTFEIYDGKEVFRLSMFPFKLSGDPRSRCVAVLTGINGGKTVGEGFDVDDLLGTEVLVQIEERPRRNGGKYSSIKTNITALPKKGKKTVVKRKARPKPPPEPEPEEEDEEVPFDDDDDEQEAVEEVEEEDEEGDEEEYEEEDDTMTELARKAAAARERLRRRT